MPLDLQQSRVSLDNPVFAPMLHNLQANILKGHGRDFVCHVFFKLDKEQQAAARAWLADKAAYGITSAENQLTATKQFKEGLIDDGGTVVTISLSATGYAALGVDSSSFLTDDFFGKGMKATAGDIKDETDEWEAPFHDSVDMLVLIADDDASVAAQAASDLVADISSFATHLLTQKGTGLKVDNLGIEHFGYADGISQPLYLEDEISKQPSTKLWNDETNLDLLLVNDFTQEEDCFGSYFVFRKLEQNVKLFQEEEGKLPVVRDSKGNPSDELAGAMIVGRFENGAPVIDSSNDFMPNPPVQTNHFNYAKDPKGMKCPLHAHTRIMTPRKGLGADQDFIRQRITRRGIPYDDVKRFGEDDVVNVTRQMLDKHQPDKGVGLLFMCYQQSITGQFRILQQFWANLGNIGGQLMNGQDSLIAQGTLTAKTLPKQWNKPDQTAAFSFDKVVTNRGGEYFFTPSIPFLRSLATVAKATAD